MQNSSCLDVEVSTRDRIQMLVGLAMLASSTGTWLADVAP